jgi:hypothetical protein
MKGTDISLHVEIPANSTAIVYLPSANSASVSVNGLKQKAILSQGKWSIKIGSGKYDFNYSK